jgi:hypothetical protein
VTGIEAEGDGNCRDINFDPLVLPAGIAPSDDPLLSARPLRTRCPSPGARVKRRRRVLFTVHRHRDGFVAVGLSSAGGDP